MKSTAEIRRGFLEFFKSKGHTIVDSSPLVPENDPTLLFINAGMNQFKNVFLGLEKRPYTRATTAQRCVRAGGKHNDLENVGFTARHHTFFEMMGNFSFGDYFKRDAIHFAWEFLTSPNHLALEKEKLTVTVYATDDEAYNIWHKEIGIPAERLIRIGDNKGAPYASDNFWQMADTGPCGPCTEIFYDHGEHIWGGPPGSPEEDGDRFIEIWNIVFMQFNRLEDGTMEPLPKPSVDTGMGIERVAAVKQHVNSNYDIDVFQYLIKRAAEVTGVEVSEKTRHSLNVIADHIRATTFLIGDGVMPSNEGRGYVLRRIIRRAIRHGYLLGVKKSFFYKLADDVIKVMEDAATYIAEDTHKVALIRDTLRQEEEQFARTIDRGIKLLNDEIAKLREEEKTEVSGKVAFTLLDTYGFPYDLTVDICKESNLTVNEKEFEEHMAEQRALAKASSKFTADYANLIKTDLTTGYDFYKNSATRATARVTAIYVDGKNVDFVNAGQEAVIITDHSPFYGESGGQVGDTGEIKNVRLLFEVADTQKYALALGHSGRVLSGEVRVGDEVDLEVNEERRKHIVLHHSAAHLLHAALREVLGDHVHQKGSLNAEGLSRFDISHPKAISAEELVQVERIVNDHIRQNHQVVIKEMSLEEAKALGAQALFSEKYGDVVRVVMMSPFSIELCGGIHVASTGELGLFKIVSESGISAGVRRVEYLAGVKALDLVQENEQTLNNLAGQAARPKAELVDYIASLNTKVRQLEKELQQAKEQAALGQVATMVANKETSNGVDFLVNITEGLDVKVLKTIASDLVNRVGEQAIVILANKQENSSGNLLIAVKGLTKTIKAGDLIKDLSGRLGGKGGGKPDQAMGSFQATSELEVILSDFAKELKAKTAN